MPKPVLTLAAAWAEFDAMVFDGSVTSASKTRARRVFYGGAQAILDILMAGPEDTESDFYCVEALSAELRRFGEDVEAGREDRSGPQGGHRAHLVRDDPSV
jgi:hypothetical protein